MTDNQKHSRIPHTAGGPATGRPDTGHHSAASGARRPVRRTVALAAGVALVATACSSGHRKAVPTTLATTTVPPTTAAPTTTLPPPVAPLTGLPSTAAAMAKPAVVIKIDNVDQARPQTGINDADVVYEVEVEGGLSRLAAVFQSKYPTTVGPVRSGRLTDEGVADDLNHPVYVFSGTNGLFLPVLAAQPVTMVNDSNHPEQFQRIGSNIPHNLFANVASLAALDSGTHGPPPLFKYLAAGHPFGGAGAAPASAVSASFPAATAAWTWNASTHLWQRAQNGTPDVDAAGRQVAVPNVVFMFINYVTSAYATGEGLAAPAPIPTGVFTGGGQAWFFVDGKVVKGTWSRPSLTSPATFSDSSGAPIAIAPGQTWVEAMPNGTIPTITP